MLSWSLVENATEYYVYYSTTANDSSAQSIPASPPPNGNFLSGTRLSIVRNLEVDTTYYFSVLLL
ncbi:MAG: hypothetical protein BKP49_01225 [Treponema sp. CETP13]|nr:MAG: hypothetical protein BKP49_01225 [Treponema sp. CETP13]